MQDTEILEREESVESPYERPAETGLADDGAEEESGISEDTDYTISAIPNDFNFTALSTFLDKGMISIPFFQRAYVWKKSMASRFIESLVLGLPVPQVFLYQLKSDVSQGDNMWIVDGQQRLLSIYYFSKGRFPRPGKTVEISRLMRKNQLALSREMLEDNSLFTNFLLDLKNPVDGQPRRLHGLSFDDLEDRISMRTLRTVVIQQHNPNNTTAAFEIFDRLNTGGVTLSPQQIRSCVYDSPFVRALDDLNVDSNWRAVIGKAPFPNQRDTEVILRVLALLVTGAEGDEYAPPMFKFLNKFCGEMKKKSEEEIKFLCDLFLEFVRICQNVAGAFQRKGRLRVTLFEGVFLAALRDCYQEKRLPDGILDANAIEQLAKDGQFEAASQQSSMRAENVRIRLERASEFVAPL